MLVMRINRLFQLIDNWPNQLIDNWPNQLIDNWPNQLIDNWPNQLIDYQIIAYIIIDYLNWGKYVYVRSRFISNYLKVNLTKFYLTFCDVLQIFCKILSNFSLNLYKICISVISTCS